MPNTDRRVAARSRVGVALLVLFGLTALPAAAAGTRNVLIIRGESPDLPGGRIIVDTIEATVRRGSTTPVEFYVETIDTGRFTGPLYERRLADLFAEKYSALPLDLVVAFSEPAVQFVMREHDRLFAGTPLLFGLVEPRSIDERVVPKNAAIVYAQVDAASTVRLALQLFPSTRKVYVVGGSSRFDRGWQGLIRNDLKVLSGKVGIEYDFDSSLPDLVRKVAALPPNTVVLFTSMTRDGAQAPQRPIDAVEALRAATRAPIFGIASTQLGHGIVGGALLDLDRHGADLGREAAGLIAGERPARHATVANAVVDWRELASHDVSVAAVPAGTFIAFREPSLWERERGKILFVGAVGVAQTALILALVRIVQRRREVQRLVERRLRFERLVAELSLTLSAVPPDDIDAALDAALARVAGVLEVDHIWRWDRDTPAEREWYSVALRAGEAASFTGMSDLPPGVQQRVHRVGIEARSAVAVPLSSVGVIWGALFGISSDAPISQQALAPQLGVIAALVATVVQRKQAEHALASSDRLKGAILDSLPAQVAVLDRDGVIIGVNGAWNDVGSTHGLPFGRSIEVGHNYLHACESAQRNGCAASSEALPAIEAACHGESSSREVEYHYEVDGAMRWFLMTAEPLRRPEGGAVVTHWDVTTRKVSEMALRESEDRFRVMADALPIAVWLVDTDASCTYLNRVWLETTGRTMEQDAGAGWLDSVHPADRGPTMDTFMRAFRARAPFKMEYRLRTRDGRYRWFLDTGVVRSGSDGAFLGYIGGCADIHERMEAERLLRDLSRRLMQAQDDERRRISRELHDHLSQELALLAVQLQQLVVQPPASLDGFVMPLQDAWRRTAEIASDVHGISHRLHPSKMEALGLVATIQAHCRDSSRQGRPVTFRETNVPKISPDRALSLYRVLEEALGNVFRHSGASGAHVTLVGLDHQVVLRVSDDGAGFVNDGEKTAGLGLVSMRERVESLNGRLAIVSVPGSGTVVEARIPLDPARDLRGVESDAPADTASTLRVVAGGRAESA